MTVPQPNPTTIAPPPWGMAVTAMLLVQLGSALSVPIFQSLGPAGTAWMRLTAGAIIVFAIARPSLRSVSRSDVPAVVALGTVTGAVTVSFLSAIERIPLGTAVAIEFLGPLTVAAIRSHSRRALVWPVMALSGVVILTEPWTGHVNVAGAAYAAAAAIGWGTYIVLTQHIGKKFDGIDGLALTLPVAAAAASVVGVPQAAGHITAHLAVAVFGLAVLMPVLPFILEMQALRSMSHSAFGTLMAIEPAFGALLGQAVLHQRPTMFQIIGIACVVTAGAASQRPSKIEGKRGKL